MNFSPRLPIIGIGLLLFLVCTSIFTAPLSLAETFSYSITLPKEEVRVETIDGFSQVEVGDAEYERLNDEGLPTLPYRVMSILLPPGQRVESFTFDSSPSFAIGSGRGLAVALPMMSEDGVAGKGAPLAEVGSGVFPKRVGRYLGTGYLQGCGIATFALFPVRVEGEAVTLCETVTVSVTTALGADGDVVVRERYRDGHDERLSGILRGLVVNPEMVGSYGGAAIEVEQRPGGFQPTSYPSLEGSAVDYLIITTDALSGEYQRLADWKTAKGVPAVVRTVEWIEANTRNGVDIQETIRFFIRDAYAKWGITYLLLGGDTDILPPRYAISQFYQGGTELPADMYFSCLDGSWNDNHDNLWGEVGFAVPVDSPDLYADIYNGRIPMSDPADLSAMIDKIIDYETAANPDYLDRFLGLAEVLFPPGWKPGDDIELNGAEVTEFLLHSPMNGHEMDPVRMYETDNLYPGAVHESRAEVIDSLNAGFNLVNHLGHGFRVNMSVGDASIINQDADTLSNDGEWFNLYMLNCTAAAYNFNCLAERFLQNRTGGAVSVIGANESAFVGASSNFMYEYYDLIFQHDVVHLGEVFARSRLPRTPFAMASDNVDLWTHYIYTILADPEMPLYNGVVGMLEVVHVANVGLGTSSILVNVSSGGQPADSALVCLSKGDEDYQYASTNALGNVIIDFTSESPGSISVVATARNFGLRQSYITVDPSVSPYLRFAGLAVDDDVSGGTYGNGDGVIDAGEIIEFTVDLENTGGTASDFAFFVLSSVDSSVTVVDSVATVGVVGMGATVTATEAVRVAFSTGIADESAVPFKVNTQDVSAGQWYDSFNKVVHAPDLDLIRLRIDDRPPLGNGNGIVESMEEFRLHYEIKNYGTGAANALSAQLEDLTGAFVVLSSTDSYPDMNPLESAENIAGFRLIENDASVENPLRIAITDLFGRVYQDTIELRIPQPPSNFVFDSSFGPDRLELSWDQSPSADVARYNIRRSLHSGGPYLPINLDPIEHAVYLDIGLAANTRYYYTVVAVDSSGNYSVFSPEYAATTNPPQVNGFPIGMLAQTTSSPAVGDIDGDGDLEIVVGNLHVYAWHHDGTELIDGDSDAVTWGVLNEAGLNFTAAIALANLDNKPGLDIVGADLTTKSVYCMDYNGELLPGWPQQAEHEFRAPPVAGDLDGDGFMDVVAVDAQGVVYAWHRDGSEIRDGDNNPATTGVFYRTPPTSFHNQAPVLCDLDGDNKEEIILGTRVDTVYAWNEDGSAVPGWPYVALGELVGDAVAGDFDGDLMPEVLVRTRQSEVSLLNHDGSMCTGWPRYIHLNDPFLAPSPAIADFDDDGTLEIVLVYRQSDNQIFIVNHDGTDYPGWPMWYSDELTESTPVVADINGDGSLDIILGDESTFMYAWDINGNMLDGFPISAPEPFRATPYLTDVDFDGDIDMIVNGWDQNAYFYDLAGMYDPSKAHWPTLQGNVQRNGRYGFETPTGIGGAVFSFQVSQEGVGLTWLLPSLEETRFNISRSVVVEDAPEGFVVLRSGVVSEKDGAVRFHDRDVEMGSRYVYRLESDGDQADTFTTEPIYVPITRADLRQNFPNPFNPTTHIVYYVPDGTTENVSLAIFDVSGARVRTLVSGTKPAGRHEAVWDARDDAGNRVSSGVYFYRLEMADFLATRKMVLLK